MTAMQSLVALWLIYVGVAVSPGVNFALIGQTATRHSRREAYLVVAGILVSSAVWMFAALFGLTALDVSAGQLFELIRIGAALYLIWLGIGKLRSKSRDGGPPTAEAGTTRAWSHFLAGLFTNLGNPKSIVFYGSLFAAVFPADATSGLRLAGAAVVLVTSLVIHVGLASLLSIERIRNGYLRLRRPIDRVFGVVFVAFGLRLLAAER